MKKRIITVMAVMLSAVCVFCAVSCEKEESSCVCTEYDDKGYNYGSTTINPDSYGAKNCSDLATKLRIEALKVGYNETFSCH